MPQNTAFSRQPIRTPTLQGSDSLQSGDVQRLTDAQRQVPLPAVPPPLGPGAQRAAVGGIRPGESLLFRESDFPGEPVTAGVDVGPGPGSEVLAEAPQAAPRLSTIFADLAARTDIEEFRALAIRAQQLGQ